MSRHTRRDFLKSAAAAGLATSFTVAGTRASVAVLGANDRLRIGVCGLNGRGQSHAGSYNGMSDAEVVTVGIQTRKATCIIVLRGTAFAFAL